MNLADAGDVEKPVLVLFRHDLRVTDNGALAAAANSGKPVVPVFVFDEESPGLRPIGGARRWWLHSSLSALSAKLMSLGAPLALRRGRMQNVVAELVEETGADTVVWNRRYVPAEAKIDAALKDALRQSNLIAQSFDGHLLHEPSLVKTKAGGFFKVYTPFWRALESEPEPRDPFAAPESLVTGPAVRSDALADWALTPTKPDWAGGLKAMWKPGEEGAHKQLQAFLRQGLNGYENGRDLPATDRSTRLSPYLTHGEITPFQILAVLKRTSLKAPRSDIEKLRKEVGWREFNYHLLFHNPDLASVAFNPGFGNFPFQHDAKALRAWQRGQTGYPMVDAGMRQLWTTGWMHNRVRMIVASFLIKDLLQDWRDGEAWFWDTLVDADPANNAANWQWVAGCGADASPFFRIYNPTLQGEKFDPDGDYVRRYVPELKGLNRKSIHAPEKAGKEILASANVKLGTGYPVPIVDHSDARDRAMQAYKQTRNRG